MAFEPVDVKDQDVASPTHFLVDGEDTVIVPNFGAVTEAGTDLNRTFFMRYETYIPTGIVHDATCTTAANVHTLTGLPTALPDYFTVRFTADADFVAGNTFSANSTSFTPYYVNGDAAYDDTFKTGSVVEMTFDTSNTKCFFRGGGSVTYNIQYNSAVGSTAVVNGGVLFPDITRPSSKPIFGGVRPASAETNQIFIMAYPSTEYGLFYPIKGITGVRYYVTGAWQYDGADWQLLEGYVGISGTWTLFSQSEYFWYSITGFTGSAGSYTATLTKRSNDDVVQWTNSADIDCYYNSVSYMGFACDFPDQCLWVACHTAIVSSQPSCTIYQIDLNDGSLLDTLGPFTVSAETDGCCELAVDDDYIYLSGRYRNGQNTRLVVIKKSDGTQLTYDADGGGGHISPYHSNGHVYLLNYDVEGAEEWIICDAYPSYTQGYNLTTGLDGEVLVINSRGYFHGLRGLYVYYGLLSNISSATQSASLTDINQDARYMADGTLLLGTDAGIKYYTVTEATGAIAHSKTLQTGLDISKVLCDPSDNVYFFESLGVTYKVNSDDSVTALTGEIVAVEPALECTYPELWGN